MQTGASGDVSPANTTTYTVSVTFAGSSCTLQAEKTVSVGEVPTVQILAEAAAICSSSQPPGIKGDDAAQKSLNNTCPANTLLEASSPSSDLIYQWSTGETTPIVAVDEPTIYSLTVTNQDGCSATNEIEITECTDCSDIACKIKMTGIFHQDLPVKNDDTGALYEGDDFVVGNSALSNPIAYVSGETITISGKITLENCQPLPTTIKVRGTGMGYTFLTDEIPTNGSSEVMMPATPADMPLPMLKVDHFPAFTIKWEISLDGGAWTTIGNSTNKLYVTWKEPLEEKPDNDLKNGAISGLGFEYYQTVYHISCKSAKGETEKDAIINKVWSEFSKRSIKRADGTALHYYEKETATARASTDLIMNTDAQCYAWCGLFMDALKIQRIEDTLEMVTIVSDGEKLNYANLTAVFLVKEWNFIGNNEVGNDLKNDPEKLIALKQKFPFTHIRTYKNDTQSGVNFVYSEVFSAPGRPGQNKSDPISKFDNHALVRIGGENGILYDPSYGGRIYSSVRDYEEENIAGFELALSPSGTGGKLDNINELNYKNGRGIDLNGNGIMETKATIYLIFYKENSPVEAEIKIRSIQAY